MRTVFAPHSVRSGQNHDISYGSIDNAAGGASAFTRRRSSHAVPSRMPSTTWRSAREGNLDRGDALTPTNSIRRRESAVSDSALGVYGASVERKVDLQLHERHAGMVEALEGYNSPMNVLLVFVPLGVAAALLKWSQTLVFVFNFLGVIPLAMILGRATEDIAAHTNQTIGGLINATFGNAVELVRCYCLGKCVRGDLGCWIGGMGTLIAWWGHFIGWPAWSRAAVLLVGAWCTGDSCGLAAMPLLRAVLRRPPLFRAELDGYLTRFDHVAGLPGCRLLFASHLVFLSSAVYSIRFCRSAP